MSVRSEPQEPRSIDKIAEIDRHIACANSGLTADSRTLIEHGRVESQNHRFNYDEPMPVESCTQSLCDLALRFSGDGKEATMVRPCSMKLALPRRCMEALLICADHTAKVCDDYRLVGHVDHCCVVWHNKRGLSHKGDRHRGAPPPIA